MPPLLRSSGPLRRLPCLLKPPTSSSASATLPLRRELSITHTRLASDSHESHYDPPGGWLWGVPPGQKYEKEGWEGVWIWGFFGGLAVGAVAYIYKPDTS